MKDGKFEMSDLDANDKFNALLLLLTHKEVITDVEMLGALEAILSIKNELLEKELKENPEMKLMFDMLGK